MSLSSRKDFFFCDSTHYLLITSQFILIPFHKIRLSVDLVFRLLHLTVSHETLEVCVLLLCRTPVLTGLYSDLPVYPRSSVPKICEFLSP